MSDRIKLTRAHYVAHPLTINGVAAGHIAHSISPDGNEIAQLQFSDPEAPKRAAESIGLEFTIESREGEAQCEFCKKGR